MPRRRYYTLYSLAPVYIWSMMCLECYAQRGVAKAVTADKTCEKLENPQHGEFKCVQDEDGEKCVLTCNDGYTIPINEYRNDEKRVLLEERGVYRCTNLPGGVFWIPNIFFDCIEKINPPFLMFYFGLTLTPYLDSCANDTTKNEQLARMNPNTPDAFGVPMCRRRFRKTCQWTYDMECVDDVWMMDAWFRIPFSLQVLADYEVLEAEIKQALHRDCLQFFVLNKQKGDTIINSESFLLECPKSTRLERDFTCRGCSTGFYLSPALAECLPCPSATFQDENFASRCKVCPKESAAKKTGLKSLVECYRFSLFEEHTSIFAIMLPLACIVVLSAVLLQFRSQVVNEPDGRHREVYQIPVYQALGGGPLQRLRRVLFPIDDFPSQFDSMAPTQGTNIWEKTTTASGLIPSLTKGGTPVFAADRASSDATSSSDSGSSYDSDDMWM